jgi:hypothetical protein
MFQEASATLLLKSDKQSIRPIMVLDTYIRLLGRIIDRLITPNIAPTLKHQFAILDKNSLADIPNTIRINIVNHPSHITLTLDLKKSIRYHK